MMGNQLPGSCIQFRVSERGMYNLKGHRSVGGMRASIYNAVPETGVDALVEYMQEFERQH